MGQSVKDAFGVDMSGITVAALESDAGLREHLFMACLAEMSSRGSVDALEDTPDAVYACAKGLFGGGGSDSGAIINTVWEKSTPAVHDFFFCEVEHGASEFFEDSDLIVVKWLCRFLEYVSRRLHIDMLPGYVTVGWLSDATELWLEYIYDAFNDSKDVSGLSAWSRDSDFDWVFSRVLCGEHLHKWVLWNDSADSGDVSVIGLSKLCLGSGAYRKYAVRHGWELFDNFCVERDRTWGDLSEKLVGEFDCAGIAMTVPQDFDYILGFLIQSVFNVRFLMLDRDVFDVELGEILTSIRGSESFVSAEEELSKAPPRLYICGSLYRRDLEYMGSGAINLFVGDTSAFNSMLHENDSYLLQDVLLNYDFGAVDIHGELMTESLGYPYFSARQGDYHHIQDLRVIPYDVQALKQDVRTISVVDGTPLGFFGNDFLHKLADLPCPLMLQRRITVEMLQTFYPEGIDVWVKRFSGGVGAYPFLVRLDHTGLYAVVDDYFIEVSFNVISFVDTVPHGEPTVVAMLESPVGGDDIGNDYSLTAYGLSSAEDVSEIEYEFGFVGGRVSAGDVSHDIFYSGLVLEPNGGNYLFHWRDESYECDEGVDHFVFRGDMSVFDKYYS